MATQAAPRAFKNDADHEERVKHAESDCRAMSSAVQSVRILQEAVARLNGEHHAFGDTIGTNKAAWNSTKRTLDGLILKSVEVGEALGALFRDHERYVSVVSCTV